MAVNVFGGGPVQPATVQYRAINLTSNLTLNWPSSYLDTTDVVAATMNVTNAPSTAFVITLPDATQVGVGMQFIFSNIGASNFTVNTHTGTFIKTAVVGTSYYFYLTDNSTTGGTWSVLTYGGTTSSADAYALAGEGLIALPNPPGNATLNTNIVTYTTNDNTFIPQEDNRSNLIVWTGGTDNIALPGLVSGDAGYYVSFNNRGTGPLTLTPVPPALFEGDTSFELQIGGSLTALWSGTTWNSLGYGENAFFRFDVLNLDVFGNSNITLTNAQAAKEVQQYLSGAGPLTGDVTVFFPNIIQFEWIVYNNTSGPFNLSVSLVTQSAPPVAVPQGSTMIFYSDGTTLRAIPTSVTSIAQITPGTAAAPGLSFTNDSTSGVYGPSVGQVGLAAGGVGALTATNTTVSLLHNTAITGNISATDRTTSFNNLAPTGAVAGDVLTYNGTNWIKVSPTAANRALISTSGTAASFGARSIVKLVRSEVQPTQIINGASVAYPTYTTLTNFNFQITPSSTNSEVNLIFSLSCASVGGISYVRIMRQIGAGAVTPVFQGSGGTIQSTAVVGNGFQGILSLNYIDNALSTTSLVKYSIQVAPADASTIFYSNTDASGNNTDSSVVLYEIGGF